MKKGINLWCFPNDWSLEKKLALASQAGFHGVELNIEETGHLTLESTQEELIEIGKLVTSYNLEIVGLSTALFWNNPLTSSGPDIREKARNIVSKMIENAHTLKVDTILVVPGLVTEDVRYDVAYETSKHELIDLARYAEELNVVIAIENVWNKFLLSPIEMKRFLNEIGSNNVKAYFDVGNILNFGFPDQWLTILDSYIQCIHVKDFKNEIGNIHGFTSLFHGDVNWSRVMDALHEIHYDGYITAEVMPNKHFPDRHIYELSNSIETIIKGGSQ